MKLRTWEELTEKEREEYCRFTNVGYAGGCYAKALELAQKEPEPMIYVYWGAGDIYISHSMGEYVISTHSVPKVDNTYHVPEFLIKELGVRVFDWEQAVKEGRVK